MTIHYSKFGVYAVCSGTYKGDSSNDPKAVNCALCWDWLQANPPKHNQPRTKA